MNKEMYYNPSKLLSYNAFLSLVIGERGVGKTYGFKKFCINHYIKKKKKFAWLRRFGTDLGETFGDPKEPDKFFKGIKTEFPKHDFSVENDEKGKMFPAIGDVEVVDTTGAGDSFCSGFIAAFSKKMPLEDCVTFANAVGAMSVMKKGATSGTGTFEETLEFIKKQAEPAPTSRT